MNNQTFISILSAASGAIGTALAGITLLPIDDVYKAIAIFFLSVVGSFLTGLLKPPTGPSVPKIQA